MQVSGGACRRDPPPSLRSVTLSTGSGAAVSAATLPPSRLPGAADLLPGESICHGRAMPHGIPPSPLRPFAVNPAIPAGPLHSDGAIPPQPLTVDPCDLQPLPARGPPHHAPPHGARRSQAVPATSPSRKEHHSKSRGAEMKRNGQSGKVPHSDCPPEAQEMKQNGERDEGIVANQAARTRCMCKTKQSEMEFLESPQLNESKPNTCLQFQ